MHPRILESKEFAHAAHDSIGQKRKYTGEPYWVHTDEVAQIIHDLSADLGLYISAEIVSHLHDVVEDVNVYPYNLLGIKQRFGLLVGDWVESLTDKYTSKNYPNLNRAERKVLEANRLSNTHPWVQTIKVADLINNTESIIEHDPNFAKTYLKEKEYLLSMLKGADPILLKRAKKQLTRAKKKLNII